MIKNVTVTNKYNESLVITLNDVEPESGLFITDISGLGPVKASVNFASLSSQDGSKFNSARVPERNVVLTLRHISTNAEASRLLTYKYFPVKQKINFKVETENRKLEIDGYVESNEQNIFSKETTSVISILCEDPYFRSYGLDGETKVDFSNTEPLFEFPLDIPTEGIEMGAISELVEKNIIYSGDADTGLIMYIDFYDKVTNLIVYNRTSRETMSIDTEKIKTISGEYLQQGDRIVINTIKGQKSMVLIREGITTNIINCLGLNTNWFTLTKGDNVFTYTADEGIYDMHFSVKYRRLYEGV